MDFSGSYPIVLTWTELPLHLPSSSSLSHSVFVSTSTETNEDERQWTGFIMLCPTVLSEQYKQMYLQMSHINESFTCTNSVCLNLSLFL